MHGRTCGLCGNADHCKMNDFQKPNRETARSCNGLVHSWTVPGNTCGSKSAVGLEDWSANPKVSPEDLIKEVEAHTSCSCTEKCAAA
ncbi:unnamed protein product [Ranitomeya imitator]|uniref:VWFD domain-containing protein n=1 Tax=Ranitomeya imitator TaxID=111125 RepID=A0ABN9LCX8_9NEOB|nr:unnamed protein product [Ranitomeya imitator]